jgi:hypothetical protein
VTPARLRVSKHPQLAKIGDYVGGCYGTAEGGWSPTAQDKVTSARGPHSGATTLKFGKGGNQGGEGSEEAQVLT